MQDKKKKYEPPIPTRVGKRKRKSKGPDAASKLPLGTGRAVLHPTICYILFFLILFYLAIKNVLGSCEYFVIVFYLCVVTPHTQCRLKLLKQERIKDYLLMEEEFIRNQEQMKPLEEKQEVLSFLVPIVIENRKICHFAGLKTYISFFENCLIFHLRRRGQR